MKTRIWCVALPTIFFAALCNAATLPGGADAQLLPDNPTSADSLRISLGARTCAGFLRYKGNPYRVSMAQNNITVTLGEHLPGLLPGCPPTVREGIEVGRLPAGNYTITIIEDATGLNPGKLVDAAPFSIADSRANKTMPFVTLDYSGHWWDPNDSGWGLFIWQDPSSSTDSLLAAWFTYQADGKPMWYVFQPTWRSDASTMTNDASIVQVTRMPGTTSPPPRAQSTMNAVGTASLDFRNFGIADEGVLTYTFTGGPTLTRTIKRFKP